PARTSSRWLGTSASAGSSSSVRRNSVDIRSSMAPSVRAPRRTCRRIPPATGGEAAPGVVARSGQPRRWGRQREVSVGGWGSFGALGDSCTDGLAAPHPPGEGYRGRADLVAAALAARSPGFRYANLAVRGRLFPRVVAEQVAPALDMGADLVSFAAGGNDVLRRGVDGPGLVARFDGTVA